MIGESQNCIMSKQSVSNSSCRNFVMLAWILVAWETPQSWFSPNTRDPPDNNDRTENTKHRSPTIHETLIWKNQGTFWADPTKIAQSPTNKYDTHEETQVHQRELRKYQAFLCVSNDPPTRWWSRWQVETSVQTLAFSLTACEHAEIYKQHLLASQRN